jgi:hypothetical protein
MKNTNPGNPGFIDDVGAEQTSIDLPTPNNIKPKLLPRRQICEVDMISERGGRKARGSYGSWPWRSRWPHWGRARPCPCRTWGRSRPDASAASATPSSPPLSLTCRVVVAQGFGNAAEAAPYSSRGIRVSWLSSWAGLLLRGSFRSIFSAYGLKLIGPLKRNSPFSIFFFRRTFLFSILEQNFLYLIVITHQ